MLKFFLALLLSALCATASGAEKAAATTVDEALAAAAKEHRPLLLDFQAQWCYSCYFMATHVLTGPQWLAIEKGARVLEVDGDSPDGANWMKKLTVKALPSYVVLKADGSELGRIVGEQAREKFYPAIERILAGSDALEVLKSNARKGSVDAVADALESFHARDETGPGLAWFDALPDGQRAAAEKNPRVAMWRDRLRLDQDKHRHDDGGCRNAAAKVLAGPIGCDRYYVIEDLLGCSEKLPDPERKALLARQKGALDDLLSHQVFVAAPTCADQRTAVMTSADLAKAIGDPAGEKAVLDRAVDFTRAALHDDFASDRNLADNLRVYLNRAGRTAEHDALLAKLIVAFPDDYVYAARFGRSLLDRGQPAQALPYLEQAAQKTFGANRLNVAELRVKALLALDRRSEAEQVVTAALEANGPWFPEQAAKLKALLKS
jgi:thiol-disulfide isomerase/thioredoxin